MIKRLFFLCCGALIVSCADGTDQSRPAPSAPIPAVRYTLPTSGPIIKNVVIKPDLEGVRVSGEAALPEHTKLWVILNPKRNGDAKDDAIVDADGRFGTLYRMQGRSVPASGPVIVRLYAQFNSSWQSSEVRSLIGEEGAKLPQAALVPNDPEFPAHHRHLEQDLTMNLPSPTPDITAIRGVQGNRLTTPDGGRSADPIRGVVEYYASVPGALLSPKWTAAPVDSGAWTVTLSFQTRVRGTGLVDKKAQWQYEPKSKTVKYLDPQAKMLSWTPNY